MRRAAHVLGALAAWWLPLFGAWLLVVGEWNRVNVIAGAAAALVAAGFGELARASSGLDAHVPLAWLAKSLSVPPVVVADFGIVAWVVLRSIGTRTRHEGSFRTKSFPAGGDDSISRGIRAFAGVSATYSPNAYVIDIDVDRDEVLLHDLVVWEQSESPA